MIWHIARLSNDFRSIIKYWLHCFLNFELKYKTCWWSHQCRPQYALAMPHNFAQCFDPISLIRLPLKYALYSRPNPSLSTIKFSFLDKYFQCIKLIPRLLVWLIISLDWPLWIKTILDIMLYFHYCLEPDNNPKEEYHTIELIQLLIWCKQ